MSFTVRYLPRSTDGLALYDVVASTGDCLGSTQQWSTTDTDGRDRLVWRCWAPDGKGHGESHGTRVEAARALAEAAANNTLCFGEYVRP
jgi:hypothetical protein